MQNKISRETVIETTKPSRSLIPSDSKLKLLYSIVTADFAPPSNILLKIPKNTEISAKVAYCSTVKLFSNIGNVTSETDELTKIIPKYTPPPPIIRDIILFSLEVKFTLSNYLRNREGYLFRKIVTYQ